MECTPIASAGNALSTVTKKLAKAISMLIKKAIAMAKTWRIPLVHHQEALLSMTA